MQGIDPWRAARTASIAALAVALSFSPMAVFAEPDDLDLQRAVEKALAGNKKLAAFEHRLAGQEGRLRQAGLLPNPELKLEVEDFAGSGDRSGFDDAQTTLSLGWLIEGRVRSRRVGVEQARSALLDLDGRALRLDVAAETAQRFLTALAHQERLAAADEALAVAEDTVASVERRARAGRGSSAELMRAEAELATVRLLRDEVTHEQAVAIHRLAAQWGEMEPRFSRVVGDPMALPRVEPFDAFAERIERNPQLARLVSQERLAQESVRLAEARRWPRLRPGLGVRHYADGDDVALVAELQLPLPLFDRNQGRVAASRAALARTRADAEAERVRVRTTLFQMYEELQHHFHRAGALRDEIVPRLEQSLAEVRRGWERGRYGYLELRTVQTELLEAKSTLIEASTSAHRLVISLERLTGETVARP